MSDVVTAPDLASMPLSEVETVRKRALAKVRGSQSRREREHWSRLLLLADQRLGGSVGARTERAKRALYGEDKAAKRERARELTRTMRENANGG